MVTLVPSSVTRWSVHFSLSSLKKKGIFKYVKVINSCEPQDLDFLKMSWNEPNTKKKIRPDEAFSLHKLAVERLIKLLLWDWSVSTCGIITESSRFYSHLDLKKTFLLSNHCYQLGFLALSDFETLKISFSKNLIHLSL